MLGIPKKMFMQEACVGKLTVDMVRLDRTYFIFSRYKTHVHSLCILCPAPICMRIHDTSTDEMLMNNLVLCVCPLQTLLQFNPTAVLVIDFDSDQQQPMFLPRVRTSLDYFVNIFTALDSLAPRDSLARRGLEERVMARELINLVACEGLQRMARSESQEQLAARMRRTGFRTRGVSARTLAALGRMLEGQPRGFAVRQLSPGEFRLTWQGRPIFAASFWEPSQARFVTLLESGDFSL